MYMKKDITLSSLHQFNSREYINKENCTTETVFFYGHKMCFVSFSMKLLKLSSNCLHKLWHLYLRSFQIHHLHLSAHVIHGNLSFMKLKRYIRKAVLVYQLRLICYLLSLYISWNYINC